MAPNFDFGDRNVSLPPLQGKPESYAVCKRVQISKLANGKDFLNLFCYTGAFTCAAARGGAKTTVSVDRSEIYLNWAKENFKLNGLDEAKNFLVKADVFKYLEDDPLNNFINVFKRCFEIK